MIRKAVRELSGYVPGKQLKGMVKLNSNENPYPPSPKVRRVLGRVKELGLYPDPEYSSLRKKIAETYGCSLEQVVVGNGSDEVLDLVSRACGGRIAYIQPSFSMFEIYAKLNGTPVKVPLEKDYSLKPDKIIRTRPNLVFIASPNNPTGNQFPLGTIEELCRGVKGAVVVDEAYADFAEYNCLPLLKRYRNLLVTRTFSKSFSLAGMRVGFGLGNRALIGYLNRIRSPFNVNRLSVLAAESALDDYTYMLRNAEKIKNSRERLFERLANLGLKAVPSEANFIFVRHENPKKIVEKLRRAGVLVRCFKEGIRISIGTEKDNRLLVQKLKGVLNV